MSWSFPTTKSRCREGDVDAARLDPYGHRSYTPDVVAVLGDGAVRRKLATTCCIQDGHPRPRLCVRPGGAYPVLTLHVGGVVGQHQEGVVVAQVVHQRTEYLGVPTGESSLTDLFEHCP